VENTTELVIQRFFSEVLNGGNYSLLDELIGRDFVDDTPSPGQPGGAAGVRAKVEGLRRAFPDLRFILEEAVAEGGRWPSDTTGRGRTRQPFWTWHRQAGRWSCAGWTSTG